MRKISKIFLFFLPLFFLTGCDTYYHFNTTEPLAYVYAFTNLDVIILMISMVLASFIYTSIVAPLALSLIGLAAVFDVFKFFFQMMRLKEDESMFFNVNLLLQFLFKIIGISVLLLGAPVGIKVLTSMPTSNAPDSFYFKSLKDIYNSFKLQPPVALDWDGKPSDYFHPDSIFYVNPQIPYKSYIEAIPFGKNLDTTGEFKVDLPIALALPISFADTLLYGDPPNNPGIIPALFPKSFPVLIFKPSLIFDAIFKNAPIMQSSDNVNLNQVLLEIAKKKLKLIHDVNYGLRNILFQYNNIQTTIYNYFVHDPNGEQLAKKIATTNNENDRRMYWDKIEAIINDSIDYQENLLNKLKDPDFLNANESDYIDFIKKYNPNEDNSYYTENSFDSVIVPKDMIPVWLNNLTNKTLYGDIKYKVFDIDKNIGNFSTNLIYLKTIGAITLPRISFKTTPIDKTSTDISDYIDETQLKVNNISGKRIFLIKYFDVNNEKQSLVFDVYAIQKNIVSDLLNKTDANLYEELISEDVNLLDNIANYDVLYEMSGDLNNAGFTKGTWIPYGEQPNVPSDWLEAMPQSESAKRTYYFNNIRNYLYELFYPNGWENVTLSDAKKTFGKYEYNSVYKIQALINYFKQNAELAKEEYIQKLTKDLMNIDKSYEEDNIALNVILKNVIADNMNDIYRKYNNLEQTFQKDIYDYRNELQKYLQMYASRYFSSNIQIKSSQTQETKTSLTSAISQLLPHGSLVNLGNGIFASIGEFVINIFIVLLSLFFKLVFIILQLLGSYIFGFLYSLHTIGIVMVFLFFPIEFTIRAIFKNEFEQPIFEAFKNYLFYRMIDFVFLFILALMGVLGPILLFMFSQMNMLIGTLFSILMIILVFYLVGVFMDKIMNLIGAQDTLGLGGIWKKTAGFMASQGVGTAVKTSMYASAASLLTGRRLLGTIKLGADRFNLGQKIDRHISPKIDNFKLKHPKITNAIGTGLNGAGTTLNYITSTAKNISGEAGKDLTKINKIIAEKNPLMATNMLLKDPEHKSYFGLLKQGLEDTKKSALNKKITTLGKQHAGIAEKIDGGNGTIFYKMRDGTIHMADSKGNIKEVKNFKMKGDNISYTIDENGKTRKVKTNRVLANVAGALGASSIKDLGKVSKVKLENGKTFVGTNKGGVLIGKDGKIEKTFDKGAFEIDKEKGVVKTAKNAAKFKAGDYESTLIDGKTSKKIKKTSTFTDTSTSTGTRVEEKPIKTENIAKSPVASGWKVATDFAKGLGHAVFSKPVATANYNSQAPGVNSQNVNAQQAREQTENSAKTNKIDTSDLANKIKMAMRDVFNENPKLINNKPEQLLQNDAFRNRLELILREKFDINVNGKLEQFIQQIESKTGTKISDILNEARKNIEKNSK